MARWKNGDLRLGIEPGATLAFMGLLGLLCFTFSLLLSNRTEETTGCSAAKDSMLDLLNLHCMSCVTAPVWAWAWNTGSLTFRSTISMTKQNKNTDEWTPIHNLRQIFQGKKERNVNLSILSWFLASLARPRCDLKRNAKRNRRPHISQTGDSETRVTRVQAVTVHAFACFELDSSASHLASWWKAMKQQMGKSKVLSCFNLGWEQKDSEYWFEGFMNLFNMYIPACADWNETMILCVYIFSALYIVTVLSSPIHWVSSAYLRKHCALQHPLFLLAWLVLTGACDSWVLGFFLVRILRCLHSTKPSSI